MPSKVRSEAVLPAQTPDVSHDQFSRAWVLGLQTSAAFGICRPTWGGCVTWGGFEIVNGREGYPRADVGRIVSAGQSRDEIQVKPAADST